MTVKLTHMGSGVAVEVSEQTAAALGSGWTSGSVEPEVPKAPAKRAPVKKTTQATDK